MARVSRDEWKERLAPWLTGSESMDGEHRGFCVKCEDPRSSKSPSASYNFEMEVARCLKACGMQGGFEKIWKMRQHHEPPKSAKKRRGRLPTDEQIDNWTDKLFSNAERLKKFIKKRGFTETTIKEFRIGWNDRDKRFTLPVYDAEGRVVNVRRYNLESTNSADKMISILDYGEVRLFLWDGFDQDEVILCEGEWDAIIGRQYGFNTVATTGGAGTWKPEWNPAFDGKHVVILYDSDENGDMGAAKVESAIHDFAASVVRLRLPMPKGQKDLTDFFVAQGHTAEDLQELIDAAKKSVSTSARVRSLPTGKPKRVSVDNSLDPKFSGQPVQFRGTIKGRVDPPFMVAKTVRFSCGGEWGDKCAKCPMSQRKYNMTLDINQRDDFLLELIERTKETRRKAILEKRGIPINCRFVKQKNEEEWAVEELIVAQSVDDKSIKRVLTDEDEEASRNTERVVYNVGQFKTQINKTYRVSGTSTASPKDGRSVFQAWKCKPVDVDIDKFKMTPEIKKSLEIFQVDEEGWEEPLDKMHEIVRDLEYNVTDVYGRHELHMAYDVVFHSVNNFKFSGDYINKGWLELLVMGDTRTGKSKVAAAMTEHYRAGLMKGVESPSLPGLIGGNAQTAGRWMTKWGLIPLNDRRLVILDEIGGMVGKGIIENMSSIRSSGIAEIVKIDTQETKARTRLIWIGNPGDGVVMKDMARGALQAMETIFKMPEDIARFDLATSAASDDVPDEVVNMPREDRRRVRHRYTSDLCSLLVTWAWSRRRDQVIFEEGVERYIFEIASKLGRVYVPSPPLIQAQNVREKLARVAVAIAARVFSTDETGENVIVGHEHVDAAEKLINMLYKMPSFGYYEHSVKARMDQIRARRNYYACKEYLLGEEGVLETVIGMLENPRFKKRDFEETGGMASDQAVIAIQQLTKWGMIARMSRGDLKMESALIQLGKELRRDREMDWLDEDQEQFVEEED